MDCAGNLTNCDLDALRKGTFHITKPPFAPGTTWEGCNKLGAFLILNFTGYSRDLLDKDNRVMGPGSVFNVRQLAETAGTLLCVLPRLCTR